MCVHVIRFLTLKIVFKEVPNITESLRAVSGDDRMNITSFSFSLADPWASPLMSRSGCFLEPFRSPVAKRFLFLASRVLSRLVPIHKWFGFTQLVLSHLCRTQRPLGMLPL